MSGPHWLNGRGLLAWHAFCGVVPVESTGRSRNGEPIRTVALGRSHMQKPYLGRVTPNMKVCDIAGNNIGTIAHIYRYADAAVAAGDAGTAASGSGQMPHDSLMEIKTGVFGLGPHLYI